MLAATATQLVSAVAIAAPADGLSLDRTHGLPSDQVKATVRTAADRSLCLDGPQVALSWDGTILGRVVLDAKCLATVRFRPPVTDRPSS